MPRVLLLVCALGALACAVRMSALSRESARTGQPLRELPHAVATVLVGVLIAIALVAVALTS